MLVCCTLVRPRLELIQTKANLIYLIKIKARTNDIDRSGVDLVLSSDASQNLQQLILLYNTDVVVAGRPNSQDLTLVMLLDASAEAVSNEVWEKE